MRRLRALTIAPVLALGLVTTGSTAAPAAACQDWGAQPIPVAASGTIPAAVDGGGPCDVWLAGYSNDGSSDHVLLEHSNGTAWSIAPTPDLGVPARLTGVAVVSPKLAWAVGFTEGPVPRTLILHWNGIGWIRVPSPNVGAPSNVLYGVTATSRDDAWAVGTHAIGSTISTRPLILHWNGKHWSIVGSHVAHGVLLGVTATSPTNAWAVGFGASFSSPLIVHWNGRAWKPQPTTSSGALSAVSGRSASSAWAVGTRQTSGAPVAVILHWDGKAWKIQHAPPSPAGEQLNGVAAVGGGAVAVGALGTAGGNTFVLRSVNGHWRREPSANPDGIAGTNILSAAATVAPGQVWTVGSFGHPYPDAAAPLAFHCC
ncbi:MAG TPA: hypothetical protein VK646_13970 [Actinomycetota bacterium]|nr:hypothetical protein [Actinomycetota bacterium]